MAAPEDQAGPVSTPLAGGGKLPFWGKPGGWLGRLGMDGLESMRGRAGPLPLPPGGMLCELTRPTPLTLALADQFCTL